MHDAFDRKSSSGAGAGSENPILVVAQLQSLGIVPPPPPLCAAPRPYAIRRMCMAAQSGCLDQSDMYTCTRMHNSPHVFRDRTQFTIHFSQIHNLPPCTWAVRNSQFPALRYDSQLASCECGRTQLRRRSINQPAWDSKIWRGENIGKPFEPQLNVFCSRFDRSV